MTIIRFIILSLIAIDLLIVLWAGIGVYKYLKNL